jgi:cyclase
VSENVFAYVQPDGSWWINNTGFMVGRRGVVSVDSCSTERRTRDYLGAIAHVTPGPVHTLVNTHHHGDHTHGNHLFEMATIVAHERCRQEVLDSVFPVPDGIWDPVEWGRIELVAPFLTFTTGIELYIDDLRCEVRHVGDAAHTTNDSIVWLPEREVLFAGDLLFKGGTPFLLMGSVTGALNVIETVLRPLGAQVIVPGHGDVCGPEVLDEVASYLEFVQRTARNGMDAGLSPLEAARDADLGPFGELLDRERIVGNLHRAYAEAAGAPRGAKIDVAAALGDMIAYNGGRPLSCYA